MTAEQYPVCPDCGERHPAVSPDQIVQMALANVVHRAVEVVEQNPGQFPDLEKALSTADQVATAVLARQPTPPAPPKPSTDDRGYGMYL